MTVLVPYDGSEQSEYALELAASIPNSELLILHVIEPFADHTEAGGFSANRYEQERENARKMIEDVVESMDDEVTVDTEIRYGRPAHTIIKVAESEGADQIVVGSHGREGAKRLLLGSVAEAVVRRADVPVTVVREPVTVESGKPGNVLVPFDGSDESKRALSQALEWYPDAEITALYVVYPPSDLRNVDYDNLGNELEDWSQDIEDHSASVLDLAVERATEDGQSISTDFSLGEPARGIVEYAEQEGPDHIVMGTRGRDGLKRLVLGSVAETVVRRSPTSVTVVP